MINKVKDSYKHNLFGIVFGPLLKVIEAIFDLCIPLFMKAILDLNQYKEPWLIPNKISSTFASIIRLFPYPHSEINDALMGGAIILVIGILGFAITMIAQYIAAKTSTDVAKEVRGALFNKILHLSKKDREKIGNSKLLTVINSDSIQLQQGVLLFIRLVIRIPVILIGSLVISFILDWRIGIAFSLIVPLIVIVDVLILKRSSKEYIGIQNELENISQDTSEVTEGARVIRAGNNQEYENIKFNEKTDRYQNKSIKVNKINALINPLTFAITSIVLVVIIYLLRDGLFSNNNAEVTSTIISEMAYLAQIFFVTVQMTTATIDIVKAGVSSKRIDEVLLTPNSVTNTSNPETSIIKDNEAILKFNKVSFSFLDNEQYFFKDLSFEIRQGETFGIIGGTGSGKTTLVNLIERFYDTNEGEILYKGIPIKNYKIEALRNDIGLVNQKSSLFKGTIKSNLLMANKEASEEDMWEALKLAEAYEFVDKYEDKLDHQVNEGGLNFSGGQRQRLCIARAILRKPAILILDDATSALDLLTDKRIRNNISSIKNITKIIISQRVSTIMDANFILVLEAGKVVGFDKHENLLKTCDVYKETFETQIKKD